MPFNKTDLIQRWASLSPRERVLLVAGVTAVSLAMLYGFVYEPMLAESRRLQQQLQAQRQIHRHLQEVAQQAAQLRQAGEPSAVAPMEPAAAIADSSQQLGIDAYIVKRQADPAEGIELELQKIPFDTLVYWLAVLQQQHGVAVTKLDMRRHAAGSTLLDGALTLNAINAGPEDP